LPGSWLSDQQDPATGMRGVVYQTSAQLKAFKYKAWGQYDRIQFLGEPYFAAYDPAVTADAAATGEYGAFLYDKSVNRNLMTNEQISKILMDNNTEVLINSSSPLKLKEGYELAIKSINVNETKAILNLKKNGQVVDTQIIQPDVINSRLVDQTYYYKTNIGDTQGTVSIAVHFKNIFHGTDRDSATVNGIFQISDIPTPLKTDQQYNKMSIRTVDATNMAVTMDNKDNQITLSKNKDITLMGKIHIKTVNQDGTDAQPLRYYIYSEEPCN
jgi:S-layer protein (TIGR01567 family)